MPGKLFPFAPVVDFGKVVVQLTASRVVRWHYEGTGMTLVNGVEPMSSADGVFRVTAAYAGPFGNAAGAGGGFAATFAPPAFGEYTQDFFYLAGANVIVTPVTVRGTGVAINVVDAFSLTYSDDIVGFGAFDLGVVAIGAQGRLEIALNNSGKAPADVVVTWSGGQCFALAPTPVSLPASSATRLVVTFTPQFEGTIYDAVQIAEAGVGVQSSAAFRVKGCGRACGDHGLLQALAAHSTVTAPTDLDFGSVVLGGRRRTAFFVTQADGVGTALTVTMLDGTRGFKVVDPAARPYVIPEKDRLGIVIEFTPPYEGTFEDYVVLWSSYDDCVIRRLEGRGVRPATPSPATTGPGDGPG
jgi:HYDIN/CFA65/VesB-like, Ig-like domain